MEGTQLGAFHLVRLEGLEPPTFWFVAKHSIQLSYSRICFSQLSHNNTLLREMQAVFSIFSNFFLDAKNGADYSKIGPVSLISVSTLQTDEAWRPLRPGWRPRQEPVTHPCR